MTTQSLRRTYLLGRGVHQEAHYRDISTSRERSTTRRSTTSTTSTQASTTHFSPRLLIFLTQHYLHKVPYLRHKAEATQEQCNQVLQNFDEDAQKHFTKVNTRPLSSLQSAFQRAQQLERLRPEPVPQYQQCHSDITEEDDDILQDDYETRSTTKASASGSNLEKTNSLKRKITEESRGKQKK
eukprot:6473427-Amphidinium_carterae.1